MCFAKYLIIVMIDLAFDLLQCRSGEPGLYSQYDCKCEEYEVADQVHKDAHIVEVKADVGEVNDRGKENERKDLINIKHLVHDVVVAEVLSLSCQLTDVLDKVGSMHKHQHVQAPFKICWTQLVLRRL